MPLLAKAVGGMRAKGVASMPQEVKGRFAPSPTGRMHAGNVFAALCAWLIAHAQGGSIVLRIEDLDRQRSKAEYIDAVQRDFERLGLYWDEGPYFQSDRDEVYQEAFEHLAASQLVYPCYCTRADLHAASAPHFGEKMVYPGTCRNLTQEQRAEKERVRPPAQRLAVAEATYSFVDMVQGPYAQYLPDDCGDFLIRRSDGAFAYQLAVVVDDAEQGVNSVVRGMDLLCSTPQQMYLQDALGLPHPTYAHIPLLVSEENRRLSKRDHDAELEAMLARFGTPEALIGHIAGITGLAPSCDPASPEELLSVFDLDAFANNLKDSIQIRWQ